MIGLALAGAGCGLFETTTPPAAPPGLLLPGQTTGVFTTARPTMGAVINDFLSRPPTPVQPIEFPHNVHVAKKIACTEYCHESVVDGPIAAVEAEARGQGLEVELGPVDRIGAEAKLRSLYLRDPDGNLVELSESVASPPP